MIPADWQEYIARKEQEIKQRPSDAPAPARRIKRHMSRRQRIAESQTKNSIKAIFSQESPWNVTPIRDNKDGLTLNVGSNCEPVTPLGKATQSRS